MKRLIHNTWYWPFALWVGIHIVRTAFASFRHHIHYLIDMLFKSISEFNFSTFHLHCCQVRTVSIKLEYMHDSCISYVWSWPANSRSFPKSAPNSQPLVFFGNLSNSFVYVPDVKPGNQSHLCQRRCNVLYSISECATIRALNNIFSFIKDLPVGRLSGRSEVSYFSLPLRN